MKTLKDMEPADWHEGGHWGVLSDWAAPYGEGPDHEA